MPYESKNSSSYSYGGKNSSVATLESENSSSLSYQSKNSSSSSNDSVSNLSKYGTAVYGASKYNRDNWKKGMPTSKILDSLLRHIADLQAGNIRDEESKQLIEHLLRKANEKHNAIHPFQ